MLLPSRVLIGKHWVTWEGGLRQNMEITPLKVQILTFEDYGQ